MSFRFTRHDLTPGQARLERFFQILPGLSSWLVIIGLCALSGFVPRTAAIVIIVFDFYWVMRLFYLTLFLMISYARLSIEEKTDWMGRIQAVDQSLLFPAEGGLKNKISHRIAGGELKNLKRSGSLPPKSADIHHLLIMPIYKEPRTVLEPGILSYIHGTFPSSRILLALAVEERSPADVKAAAQSLRDKYRSHFLDFLVIIHPDGTPGEARVKGANATHAAKAAQEVLASQNIAEENVIVSCFDADTVVSPQYFACLTYNFMICPQRLRASFQPIPVYHNNIWDVPGFARILEMGASFFQLTEATHPDRLVTFSSHSMSFKALVEVDYWPIDMVSDDSAIFWKALLFYRGDYRTVPMYVTLSMDVADAGGWWATCVHVYKQKRRWAWGVENFPIVMRGFLQTPEIPLFERFRHGFKLFEGHLAWATWPFILGIIGWLPGLFMSREFSDSVLYYTAPRIAATIFNLATLSLLTTIALSLCLLPKKKVSFSFWRKTFHALEWLTIPVVAVFFSALPALDAQTRLMLGKYMEFWVTDKRR